MKFEHQQLLDEYLGESFEFRHNILSGKYEMDVMVAQYKDVPMGRGVEVKLGKLLRTLNFQSKPTKVGTAYFVVPLFHPSSTIYRHKIYF